MNRPWIVLSFLIPFASAAAADLRQMTVEPGEWLVTTGGTLVAHSTHKICIPGSDAIADLTTRRLGQCSRKSVEIGAAAATIDADCILSGVHAQLHATATPTGEQSWRAAGTVRIEGFATDGKSPAITLETTISAKRIGPCPGG